MAEEFPAIPGVTLIGLGNKARNGKDTVADYVCKEWPSVVRRYAFADALKVYCRTVHGMTRKDGNLLQRVGFAQRQKDINFWIRALYWRIEEDRPRYALITDVRHWNEADFVRNAGGMLIRVRRIKADGTPFIATDRDPNHPSEIELDTYNWDYTLDNLDGNLGPLLRDASQLFNLDIIK